MKDEFEQGYMIESVWKFLIYTEIAKSLYEVIKEKPLYAKNETENAFLKFVEKNDTLILTDFSTRLERRNSKLSKN